MADKIQKYEGKDMAVYFEGDRCIHAARCVSGLPNVFKAISLGHGLSQMLLMLMNSPH